MKDKLLELLSSIPVDKINFMKSVLQVLLSLNLLDKIINYFKHIEVLGYKIVDMSYHRGENYYSNFFLMELDVKNPKSNDVFISEVIIKNIELTEYFFSDIYIDCFFDNNSESFKIFAYNNGNITGKTSKLKVTILGNSGNFLQFEEIEYFDINPIEIDSSSIKLYWELNFKERDILRKYRDFKIKIIFNDTIDFYLGILYNPFRNRFFKQFGNIGAKTPDTKFPFFEIKNGNNVSKTVSQSLEKEKNSKIYFYLFFHDSCQVNFNVGLIGDKNIDFEKDIFFLVRKNIFNQVEKKINMDGYLAVSLSRDNIKSLSGSEIEVSYPLFFKKNDINFFKEKYSDDYHK